MLSTEATEQRLMFKQLRDSGTIGQFGLSIEERRARAESVHAITAEPSGVRWVDETVGGVACKWAIPEGDLGDGVIEYFHGGGWVVLSIESHRKFTGHLAVHTGCRVLSVGYRLAPEHPHPAQVEDCVAVYRALLDRGHGPDRSRLRATQPGRRLPSSHFSKSGRTVYLSRLSSVAMSLGIDLAATGASISTNAAKDFLVDIDLIKTNGAMFLGDGDPNDPLITPLTADLTGIAPLYIQIGGDEVLLDDATRLATKAAANGVEVRLDVFPGMQHVFQLSAGNVPEADGALGRIAEWLRPRFSPSRSPNQ